MNICIYIYLYIYIYIYIFVYIYIYIYIYMWAIRVQISPKSATADILCIYTYLYIFMYEHMYMYVCINKKCFNSLLHVKYSCSSTQSWGSVLPSIVETGTFGLADECSTAELIIYIHNIIAAELLSPVFIRDCR